MLVDTAAQISMVDEALADELRLEHLEDAGIIGVTGVSPGWIARLRRIRLKDRELRDWRVMVGPQPGTLLLGMDVLDRLELAVGADALEGP
jgi:predicted aspartyl protease